ncbi:hypothetical protein [Iodobacter fluviatilis]|uniref:Bundle-forming pilus B n=1 Tax=Iodobacter fluviatilis TaxID=537 RepID=A0A377Q586_9NEIS|nr:hypothetical protein [Iodobacter fluviatilis]TCU84627.1 type IVB pilus formation R64 PilN family outer membrane protein [Iodobacter fluviatilis]STQ90093.1 Bundle-forming pilus B [Iodobacter fluviatilis]
MFKKSTISGLVALSLTACSTMNVEQKRVESSKQIEQAKSALIARETLNSRPTVERVNGSYLGSRTVPLSREASLPAVFAKPFQHPVRLVSEGRINLTTAAEIIHSATGIVTEISPDVYVKNSTLPNGDGKDTGISAANTASDLEANITLDWKGSLAGFLDSATARLGIAWEFKDNRLQFFRYKTTTYEVKSLAGIKEVQSEFNSSGNVATSATKGGSGGNSVINVQQKSSAKLDFWGALNSEIKAYLTAGGRVSMNEAVGTVTVTDTPVVHRQIAQVLSEQNRRISRTVYFRIDLINVTARDGVELGLSLDAIYNDGFNSFKLKSPGGLNSTSVGSLSGAIMAPVTTNGVVTPGSDSPWAGSSVVINALKQVANVEVKSTMTATTINNSPVPFTMATTQSYVDSVGSSSAQGSGSTQVTVDQKQVTTGIFMQLLPRLLDNNKMLLSYTVDTSVLQGWESTPTAVATLKSPIVPRRATSQTVNINVGETVVLSAMNNLTLNRDAKITFGGSYANTAAEENLLILITPVLVDNDAALEPGKYFKADSLVALNLLQPQIIASMNPSRKLKRLG